MAMTLRLTETDRQALKETADREHRSMQDVALTAVRQYTGRRSRNRAELIERIATDHARVLKRLGE